MSLLIYEFAEITTDLLKGDHNLTWSYFYFLVTIPGNLE